MRRADTVSIRLATTAERERWDSFVIEHPAGLPYHRFAWKEAVERAYGFRGYYFLAEAEGRVRGILPLIHLKMPLTRGTLVSLPYCDLGGVVTDHAEVAQLLAAEASSLGKELCVQRLELRQVGIPGNRKARLNTDDRGSGREERFSVTHGLENQAKVRMVLDLPRSSEALMASLKSKVRSQVRKPEKDGLRARLGGKELVADFYRVFAENMRDLGSPVHSRGWIEAVIEAYGEDAQVGIAYLSDGTPGAGGIVLSNGKTISIPWASSLRRYNRQNPNMLLYWTFLSFAADNGFTVFDFGRSTPGEGTYRFKEQWGARPQPLSWRTVNLAGPTMPSRASRPGLRHGLEALWRRLPVPLANGIGPLVRRYVSL